MVFESRRAASRWAPTRPGARARIDPRAALDRAGFCRRAADELEARLQPARAHGKLAETVGKVTIDKVAVIDGGSGNGVGRFVTQLPGAVISLAEQIETVTGVNILNRPPPPQARD